MVISLLRCLTMYLCNHYGIAGNTRPVKYDARNPDDLRQLRIATQNLRASGGGDCEEYGMKGIYDAIIAINGIDDVTYSNVIVLTDAGPKDSNILDLKNSVINLAKSNFAVVHFFLSPNRYCAEGSDYVDVAEQTCGIVVRAITDFNIFTQFANQARGSLATCDAKRKRHATNCVTFGISVLTDSLNILFTTDGIITISIPGSSAVKIQSSGSYAVFNRSNPSAGTYSACSDRNFDHVMSVTSSFDFTVEYYGNTTSNIISGNLHMYVQKYF